MKFKIVLAAIALAVGLSACAQNGQYGNKQVLGGLGGAALGGWAGSSVGKGSGRIGQISRKTRLFPRSAPALAKKLRHR